MLENLINPKKAEKRPWEMFFIGAFYALISLILVKWVFAGDPVLSRYQGLLVVTFTVIFSLPFMYYAIKNEEQKDLRIKGFKKLIKEHGKAILYLMFLFMGFIFTFSVWYVAIEDGNQSFKVQIETYCAINRPTNFDQCVSEYGMEQSSTSKTTGFSITKDRFLSIFINNIYVLIFTLIFSLLLGAGAIFILAWNASVISAAVGIFAKSNLIQVPIGILKYMIHGIPEIAAYFTVALAGGIVGVAVIKHEIHSEKFWIILQDSLNLIILAIALLLIACFIEVFITPIVF